MFNKISTLPPEALKYILNEIENLSDDDVEKQQLMRIAKFAKKTLGELDKEVMEVRKKSFNIQRYFFLPFEKLLFTGDPTHKQDGCVSRHSMNKIWAYIQSNLLSEEVKQFEASFNLAVKQKEIKKAKTIINEFNRLVGQKLEESISIFKQNDRDWRRFVMLIGDDIAAQDAEELCYYLQNIPAIEKATKYLSNEIVELNGNSLVSMTEEFINVKQQDAKLLPFYVTLLISQLKRPEHALRIIQKYYRIDDASAASKCDLSVIGEILIFNAEIYANNFSDPKKSSEPGKQRLYQYTSYAKIVLGFEREFDVSPISSWGKKIIDLRKTASSTLSKDIVTCPRLIKQVLGNYQTVRNGVIASAPDQMEINKLYDSLIVFHGVKNFIAATSCNAIYNESYKTVMQFIEVLSVSIVDTMRKESHQNQQILLKYLEIATEMLKIIKDEDQASVYYKSGTLAIRSENVA